MGRDGRQHRHGEHAIHIRAHTLEGRVEQFESFRDRRSELAAGFCQRHLSRQAREERRADPVLQHFDLIAHGSLGHAEFLGRAGEALMARRRFEGANSA
jgi:hypothetical protein